MQVWRWAGQYKASLLDGEAPLPEMLRLGEWLSSHIPLNDSDPNGTRISHGDYRSGCSRSPLIVVVYESSPTACFYAPVSG